MAFLATKYFELFIDDFKKKQVDVSLLKGKVRLDHAQLNVGVLQSLLGLPPGLRLTSANCGDLQMRIPWSKLRKEAVEVELGSLSVVVEETAEPRPNAPLPALLAKSRSELSNRKRRRKKKAAVAKRHWYDAIVENVRLRVGVVNVVVSLLPAPGHGDNGAAGAAAGGPQLSFTVDSLALESCNGQWQPIADVAALVQANKQRAEVSVFKRCTVGAVTLAVCGNVPGGTPGRLSQVVSLPFEARLLLKRCHRAGHVTGARLRLAIAEIVLDWEPAGVRRLAWAVRALQRALARSVVVEELDDAAAAPAADDDDDDDEVQAVKQTIAELKQLNAEGGSVGPASPAPTGSSSSDSATSAAAAAAAAALKPMARLEVELSVGVIGFQLHTTPSSWNAVVNGVLLRAAAHSRLAERHNRRLLAASSSPDHPLLFNVDTPVFADGGDVEDEDDDLALTGNRVLQLAASVDFACVRDQLHPPLLQPADQAGQFFALQLHGCMEDTELLIAPLQELSVRGHLVPVIMTVNPSEPVAANVVMGAVVVDAPAGNRLRVSVRGVQARLGDFSVLKEPVEFTAELVVPGGPPTDAAHTARVSAVDLVLTVNQVNQLLSLQPTLSTATTPTTSASPSKSTSSFPEFPSAMGNAKFFGERVSFELRAPVTDGPPADLLSLLTGQVDDTAADDDLQQATDGVVAQFEVGGVELDGGRARVEVFGLQGRLLAPVGPVRPPVVIRTRQPAAPWLVFTDGGQCTVQWLELLIAAEDWLVLPPVCRVVNFRVLHGGGGHDTTTEEIDDTKQQSTTTVVAAATEKRIRVINQRAADAVKEAREAERSATELLVSARLALAERTEQVLKFKSRALTAERRADSFAAAIRQTTTATTASSSTSGTSIGAATAAVVASLTEENIGLKAQLVQSDRANTALLAEVELHRAMVARLEGHAADQQRRLVDAQTAHEATERDLNARMSQLEDQLRTAQHTIEQREQQLLLIQQQRTEQMFGE